MRKNTITVLALLAVLTCASLSMAATGKLRNYSRLGAAGVVITAATLDAASTTFTYDNLPKNGTWGLMLVYVKVTDSNDSVTALTMSCTGSIDDNTTDYSMTSCSVTAGVCTSTVATFVIDPSGITSPKKWLWRVDIEGIEDIQCVFTDTGGLIADTLDVSASLAAK